MLLFAIAVAAGSVRVSVAQTVALVDYDIDDDGLIEVRNNNQFRAINDDLNGDGIVTSSSAYWNTTGYPNAMTAAGCGARDHDNDPATSDEVSCIGYELTQDLVGTTHYITGTYTAKIVGNGFRIVNSTVDDDDVGTVAKTLSYTGTIEGIGVVNPSMGNHGAYAGKGGIVNRLEGDAIGVYVEGGSILGDTVAGIARYVTTHATSGEGLIAHSYVLGTRIGEQNFEQHGGLASVFEHSRGPFHSTCLNSFFSGNVDSNASHHGLIGAVNQQTGGNAQTRPRIINCYGDGTTDNDENAFGQNNIAGPKKTKAEMTNPTGYTGIYADWDNYAADGTQLGATDPPTDFWYFADSETFPALKGFGHDRTHAPARSTTGTDTVNLCTRTLPVANAIIELLNDTHVLGGVTPTPTPTTLLPCTSASDTRSVTITQLAQLAVTGPGTHLNLRPDRTFPPSAKLTELDLNDFAYLTNVAHIELAGNDLETLPPRLFHGVSLRYLDLSGNKLTSLPADLFAGVPTVTATVGNALVLSDNNLTDTGLPGRIFDPLTHINGLDLSNNALTRVNTRWFEALVNLGRKATTNPRYTHGLGLHLAGNTITEHYYSHKLFSGIRDNVVTYADTTSGTPPTATTAGNTLRTAITAAITAAAGGTTPTTLSLTGTDYYFNTGGTTGYQASTVTACQATQTAAPGRYAYLENDSPDCHIQPHWSPPHKSADTAATAPGLSTSGSRGTISVEFTHTSSTAFVAYQIRYRPSSIDPWTPWLVAPITLASGTKTVTIGAPESGLGYAVEMRVLTTTGPPSAPISGTATTSPSDWIAGYSVDPSTTTPGSIDLSWTAFDAAQLPAGHTLIEFYYRYKLSTATYYGVWTRVPDGSDTGNSLHDETSYTLAGLTRDSVYDVQLVGGIDSADSDTDADYFTNRQSGSAAAFSVPADLRAVPGSTPGTIAVTWSQQSLATTAQSRFRIRWKRKSAATWTGATWTAVADSDSDSQTHDETAYTITGLLASNEEYDIEVAFYVDGTVQWLDAVPVSAFPNSIPAPTGLAATTSTTLGAINASWSEQSYSTASNAKLQVRVRTSPDGAWIAWQDVSDGADADSDTYNETAHTVTGLTIGRPHDVQVRIVVGTTGGTAAQVDGVKAGFHPQGMTAVPGSTLGTIDVSWTQQTVYTETWRRFHISYKLTTANTWESWINIADETASSHQLTGLTAGARYDIRMMFNRNSEHDWPNENYLPMLTAVRAAAPPTPTGLSATTSQSAGEVDLSWDQQTAHTGSNVKFQVRAKPTDSSAWPAAWTDVPDSTGTGGDADTNAHNETGYTVTGLDGRRPYDFQLRLAIGNASSLPAEVTNKRAGYQPRGLTASTGTTPGTIDLSWTQQTAHQANTSMFLVRFKPSDEDWPADQDNNWHPFNNPYGWRVVDDSEDADLLRHDEDSYQLINLRAGVQYDVNVSFTPDGVVFTHRPSLTLLKARAATVPAPTNLTATAEAVSIALSWDTQTATSNSQAKYQVRYKKRNANWPTTSGLGWADISGSNHATNSHHILGLDAGDEYDVQLRFHYSDPVGTSPSTATVSATPAAITAITGVTAGPHASIGQVDFRWSEQTQSTSPDTRIQVRSRTLDPTGSWIAWYDVPDRTPALGGDADTNAYNETSTVWISGYQPYRPLEVQVRLRIGTGFGPITTVTNVRTGHYPLNLSATAGTAPGTIQVTWDEQTRYTNTANNRFRVRYKASSSSTWGSWTEVADNSGGTTDAGTHRYDETQYTITGLTAGTAYDIGMSFWGTSFRGFGSDNWHPTVTSINAAIVQPPVNFTAATSTDTVNAVELSWDAQTASSLADSKFQYRYKLPGATWGSQTWNDVDDGGTGVGDSDANHYNETGVTVTGLTANTSYDFQLRFRWNATAGSSTSVGATATSSGIPVPPSFSASSGTAAGTVDLSWDAVNGITKYQYRYKKTDANTHGSWADIPDDTSAADPDTDLHDETSYTVTGLDNGDNYEFHLRAHTAANTFGPEATATARAQTQAPPTGLTAATGTNPGEIALSWTPPPGSSHTGFQYRYKRTSQDDSAYEGWENVPDSGTDGRANETAYTVASLWAGVGYTLQLRAQSANGASEPGAGTTATATAQVVAAPTGFSATIAEAPGAIDLSWTALLTTGLPTDDVVVNYQYRYKLNSATSFPTTGAGSWTDMPTANTTSFRITGLNIYEAYDVDIRAAINDNDEGTATTAEYYSSAASDTNELSGLAAPDNLRATGGTSPGQVALTWNAQTTFGTGFTAAKYQYRTRIASPTATWPSGGGWTDVPSSTRTTTSYTIPNLMNGQEHDIQLRFVPSGLLTGGPSSVQGTPTVVAVPTGFTASTAAATAGAISLTWTAQIDGTSSEAKYQYRRKLTSTGGPNTGWPAASPYGWTDIGDGSDADSNAYNENSLTFTGLDAGESYHVQLRFHWSDAVGASVAAATQTASASNVPIPGSFSASSGSAPGSINLTWAAVTDASYQFRYKLATTLNYPTSGAGSWASAGSGTSYTIMGLTNAASYHVQLRAVVSGSSSQPTATATAQAQSQPGPQSFSAAQGTNAGELNLTWQAPSQGSPTRYDYRYKRATQAGSAYSGWASAGTGTSFTVAGLWAGVSYNVQLIAVTAVGNSLPVTATQTAQELAAPGSLAGTIGDNPGEIDLTWNAITSGLPSGDTVVQYQYRTKLPSASWPTTAPLGWVNIPAANTASYTITGLTSGTQYDVQLRAAVADGTEGTATTAEYHSDPAAATSIYSGLAQPANLRATASTTVPGSIVLAWNQQSAFTAGTEKYEFRRKLTTASWPSGGGWADVPSSTHSTTGHTLTDLTNGEDYNIEVRFYHSSTLGSSAATTVTGEASSIAVPTGFTAATSTTTAGAIDLRWNAQTAVTVSTALFQVRTRSTAPGSNWSDWAPVPDDTSSGDPDTDQHDETRHTLTGLTADQRYNIELRLFMSTAIGASDAATASATASSVPVPTGLDATTGSGAGEIDVTWTAVIGATSYQYRYKLASALTYPSTGTGSWATTSAATSQTIQNLSGGEWYNVQVRALVTGIGQSQPTQAVRAQAQTTPGPATLTFSHGPNPGDIKIDWTAPAMNAPVEHYEYRYKLESALTYPSTGDGSWAEVLDSNDAGTSQDDETTYTITGLQAGVSYHVQFRVFASNAIGYSLPQRGTQTARPVPPPTSFSAIGGGDPGEVVLSWTPPAGVTILRYELRHRLGTTGAWSSWTSATASPYTYTTLLAGMSRTFELRAVMQTVGASAAVSTTGIPTPVPTPASFMATTGTFPGEVDLSWMSVTGATSYEYRYRLSSLSADPWPAAEGWTSVAATMTSTTITLLNEGAAYTVEVRAAITNVGRSMAASASASARGATFMDQRPNAPAIHAAYAVDAAAIPGRIAIELPGGTDPFIYRYQTANPGQWSRWYKVSPQAGATQFLIPDLVPGVRYNIEVRAYTGMTTGFTTPLTATAQAAPLVAAEDFTASESSGVILLQWSSPALYTPAYYEYRTKPTGTQTWSEWIRVDHEGDRGSTQRKWVTGLESGISHDFELRMQTGAGPSPEASTAGSARLRIAEVHSIRPTVREVSVRAGDTIALTVDIYDTQEVLDNSIPGKPGSKLVFRWMDMRTDSNPANRGPAGGTFAAPTDERRVTYTAPSSAGTYTVTAEAQPDGVCTSHHEGAAEITDAERAQCTATFTIRVSGIPAVPAPRPDPVDPTGAIPTSMTDDKGGEYTVFTPTKGGTFQGTDITVTAPAGAIPDRTVVGIGATVSDIPTPDPIPGATMSLAGSYYDINAVADNGEPPIPSYTLNEPATACLPFPQEFRADLSNVVVVQRKSSGDLSILSTKIRSNAGTLTVCGTLTQLPATVAVARLGLVPAPAPTTPSTPADTPDTGATAPSYTVLLLTLLTGALLLTGMRRISRIIL